MLKQLFDEEIKKLPIWAKLIIFHSVLKIGSFNCSKKEFLTREDDLIAPFIEIDMESLKQCILFAKAALDIENLEEKKLKEILSPKNMAKLYSNLVSHKKSNLYSNLSTKNSKKQQANTDIQWIHYWRNRDNDNIEYNPNIKPVYQAIYDSLQGHNTGWDIAINIEETKSKNRDSDMYIGFTKDEKGNYTIPRVAYFEIPDWQGEKIEKVIGLGENQTVEPELQSIVDKRIEFYESGKKYLRRQNDKKRISTIYSKWQNKAPLTKEDLEFLYELDEYRNYNISGDYRIKEILKSRDKEQDLMFVFGCQKNEISLGNGIKYVGRVDAFPKSTKYHIGLIDLYRELYNIQDKNNHSPVDEYFRKNRPDLYTKEYLDSKIQFVNLPTNLVVGKIKTEAEILRKVNFPKKLVGDLSLVYAKQISKVTFPEEVIGNIYLNNISNLSEPIILPRKIKGNLWINSLRKEDLRWITLPEEMEGEIAFNGSYLNWSLAQLKNIQQELKEKEELSEEKSHTTMRR